MQIPKINPNNYLFKSQNITFKSQKEEHLYTKKDVLNTSDKDELLKIIDSAKSRNMVLNAQLENTLAELKKAQIQYLYAKGRRDELDREKMKLKGYLAVSYDTLEAAEKKYNDIVSGQYMKSEKARQLRELQIKIEEIDSQDGKLADLKAQIGDYISILES